MTHIIAVINQKGGVGKTTISTQLAFDLALHQKKRVLYIDMDAQGNGTSVLLGEEEITGDQATELFNPESMEIHPQRSAFELIDILPTERNSALSYQCEKLPESEYVKLPKEKIALIADQYDFIVIDAPPNMCTKAYASLTMATHVLCPVRFCGFSNAGLEGLLTSINRVQAEWNPDLEILGILVNALDRSTTQRRNMKEAREALQGIIFEHFIPNRTPLDTANTNGIPIWEVPSAYVAARDVELALHEVYSRLGFQPTYTAFRK